MCYKISCQSKSIDEFQQWNIQMTQRLIVWEWWTNRGTERMGETQKEWVKCEWKSVGLW